MGMRHLGLALGLALTASAALAQHASHEPAAHAHGPAGRAGADTPATQGFKAAHGAMMRAMAVPYTGDPDVDFRLQMIPHHQGAIAMAQVALAHAKDAWTRQLAEAVIVEQQREIAEMEAWLTRRGVPVPAGGTEQHVLTAGSFRSQTPEAGTRAEARGQSWAPGAGIR
jgi:hypothetical protein